MREILIGLGNPGKKYALTYHTAGALALDFIYEKLLLSPEIIREGGGKLFDFRETKDESGEKIIFVRPTTFMNESGLAVRETLKFFRADAEEVVLLHDDSDLNLGTAKVSESKNLAGHHGLLSVERETGKTFKRIRIGIRDPKEKIRRKAEEFVLKNIPKNKMKELFGQEFISSWSSLRKRS